MTVTTTATVIRYEYDPDVKEYSIPFQYREYGDIKAHYFLKIRPSLWIWRKYVPLTEDTDYTVKDGIFTLLTELPEDSIIEIFRATVPTQAHPFPQEDLCQDYEEAIDKNTLCLQELHTWLHHLEHELRQFEHFVRHEIKRFEHKVCHALKDFDERLKAIEEQLNDLHIADLPYVLSLAKYMTLLLQYAREQLLTDLRYPVSDYRPAVETYGLDTAILIVQGQRVIRFEDEGECDV